MAWLNSTSHHHFHFSVIKSRLFTIPHPYLLERPFTGIKRRFKELSKDAQNLVITNIILSVALGLGGLFLNIFLYRESQSLDTVVLFNLIQFPNILVGYLVAGTIKKNLKMRFVLQTGLFLYIVTFALLTFVRGKSADLIFPIGLLYGLATGFFWAANNALTYKTTYDGNRDIFYSLNSSLTAIVSILTPPIAGLVISQGLFTKDTLENYPLLFLLVNLTLAVGFFQSFSLPEIVLPKLDLGKTLNPLKNKTWQIISLRDVIDGIKGGAESFIGPILVYEILRQELRISAYVSIFSFLGAIVTLKLGTFLKRDNRLKIGFLGSILLLFERLIYVGLFSLPGLLISSTIGLLAGPFFGIGLISTFFDAVDHAPNHEKDFYEYIALREFSLTAGRMVSILLFLIFLNLGNDITITKSWYLILGTFPLLYFFLTRKFELGFDRKRSLL